MFQLSELEARVQEAEARADRAEDKVRLHSFFEGTASMRAQRL